MNVANYSTMCVNLRTSPQSNESSSHQSEGEQFSETDSLVSDEEESERSSVISYREESSGSSHSLSEGEKPISPMLPLPLGGISTHKEEQIQSPDLQVNPPTPSSLYYDSSRVSLTLAHS